MKLIALLTALVASTTFAHGECKTDRESLCPGIAKGPALKACMREHAREISPTCKQAIETRRAAHHARRTPGSTQPSVPTK